MVQEVGIDLCTPTAHINVIQYTKATPEVNDLSFYNAPDCGLRHGTQIYVWLQNDNVCH